jgi:hypothetical protein
MDFESVLTSIGFKRRKKEEILAKAEFLKQKYDQVGISKKPEARISWVMGELRKVALGNINLTDLAGLIK